MIAVGGSVAESLDDGRVCTSVAHSADTTNLSGTTGPLDFLRSRRLANKVRLVIIVVEGGEKLRGFILRRSACHALASRVEWAGRISRMAGVSQISHTTFLVVSA